MPRKETDPLIKSLHAFETSSLEKAEFALQIAAETVKRRRLETPAGEGMLPLPEPKRRQRRKKKLIGSTAAAADVA